MGCRQIGQRKDVEDVGGGTVRMERRDLASMGGLRLADLGGFSGSLPEDMVDIVVGLLAGDDFCESGRPEMIGGGSSSPSAALRESWRAKSDACHHSRNLSAKMEVGRRIFKLESNRG